MGKRAAEPPFACARFPGHADAGARERYTSTVPSLSKAKHMIEPSRAALLLIDMQNGFIEPTSALCVAGAKGIVPACARALDSARARGITIFHVRRAYQADGSDVEPCRYSAWVAGGKPLSTACDDAGSLNWPDLLTPADGDRVMVKPRFSAFFDTPLDELLSREGRDTVVLAGTNTANCVRSTCYDALSLNYNVIVLEDATAAPSPSVQRANLADMQAVGAQIMSVSEFERHGLAHAEDVVGDVARAIEAERNAHACRNADAPDRERPDAEKADPTGGKTLPPCRAPRGI